MRDKLLAIITVSLTAFITACGTIAEPIPNSATLEAQRQQNIVEAPTSANAVVIVPTNTAISPTNTPVPPTATATLPPTEVVEVVAETEAVATMSLSLEEEQIIIFVQEFGNPVRGQEIFNTSYEVNTLGGLAEWRCSTCHAVDSDVAGVGPGLYSLSERAGGRISGMPAELYTYNSIVLPLQYIVSGYPENLMPIGYAETLSSQDLYDVAAYILSLNK